MIITDKKIVSVNLDILLDKVSSIPVDRQDLQNVFGDNPNLRMMRVAADSIDELLPLMKQEFASIGGLPDKCLAVYVSLDMKMSDLELLEDITKDASQCKRAIVFEKSPLGDFLVYCFFE